VLTVGDVVAKRGITEVLHFTTNRGLAGILASRGVKARNQLPADKFVEHVYGPTCKVRRDTSWLGYVNLSITSINSALFNIASRKWYPERDFWWCVLSFTPLVLEHEGVLFVTTNNMYTGAKRLGGAVGLEALFSPSIVQFVAAGGATGAITRALNLPPSQPTCRMAEALYPTALSTEWLQRVYVATAEHADIVHGQCDALSHVVPDVAVRPDVFE